MAGELGPDPKAKPVRKAATAYRTISEVSDDLEVPQHVLRFWETKFSQIRPLKRGGGRRYYRPEDIQVLRRIQRLLYEEGYTIKGVQRLLKESKEDAGGEARTGAAPARKGERKAREGEPPELPLGLPPRAPRAAVPAPFQDGDLPPELNRELSILLMELKSLKSLLTGAVR
jgi:DNA-binding transcriptional MerR regulator